jgi:nucleotide sugar dehydrogenase
MVGAANAVALASARNDAAQPLYDVIGVELTNDIGRERAASINEGRLPFETTDKTLAAAVQSAHAIGNLSAGTDYAAFAAADIIVIDVGVDLESRDERSTFNLSSFRAALTAVGDYMRPNALVLLESTVPPGASEQIAVPLLRERLGARGLPHDEFLFAYAYERVMPGDQYFASIVDMRRVYSGLTPEAADAAEEFLSSYVNVSSYPLFRLRDIRSVEFAKVLENTYRAVNIALIDEWERFARRIDIDLFEVLEAIRARTTHSNIRYPGLGVGGYCLTKDPMFGIVSACDIYGFDDLQFPISAASVRINSAMPVASAEAIEHLLSGRLSGRRVLVLGVSYRPDVGDTRSSPTAVLAASLIDRGAQVEFSDPLAASFDEVPARLHNRLPLAGDYDVIVFAVAHREYRELDLLSWIGDARPLIFDANGVFSSETLCSLQRAGLRVGGIGRGRLS